MLVNFSLEKQIFKEKFLYKAPCIFKNATNTNGYTWNDVNELYCRGDIAQRDFKLMNGYEVPKKEYVESYDNLGVTEYRCITSVLYNYLRTGATLVRNRIKNEPIVDAISRQIGQYSESRTITGSYAAFSSRSSYKSHWDTRDVYAVQLLGRKRWILKKPNFDFPLYMQQTKNFPNIEEPKDIYMDVVLEAGDILYIPRGWWHDPLPLDEETFHLAVATFPPNGFEYIRWLENSTPNILDFRKNFSNFEDDQVLLNNISSHILEVIKDKKSYENFMMNHMFNHNVSSSLSLNVLGNGKVNKLPEDQKLCLNANTLYLFNENTLIINGNKVSVDNISFDLIKYIYNNPFTLVRNIISHFSEQSESKINKLLFSLSIENIIGLVK